MTDRRRINGPLGGTAPLVFTSAVAQTSRPKRPERTRASNELRKIFLRTGLTPSASGSAYLELNNTSKTSTATSLNSPSSNLKITCTVHGPRPLPRSAPFSPNIVLSTHVKYAPFATRQRRGYLRDTTERDLAVHLESALKGVIIADRWPKSGVDIIVTILEGEEDGWEGDGTYCSGLKTGGIIGGWGTMTVLAGCITASCAALVNARIDCLDLICGGVAAVVDSSDAKEKGSMKDYQSLSSALPPNLSIVLDPNPVEHPRILAACVVGYMETRDEMTELWSRGNIPDVSTTAGQLMATEELIDHAIECAKGVNSVLKEAVKESAQAALIRANCEKEPSTILNKPLPLDIAMQG
ncbi:MAG: 3'-5'-exoribonuclease [Cirrosporium novae-zelandiae]|nr:MAG: 3'-5'-exoribonuclease [Cirrosporium novae-zelandiae]